MLQRTLKKVLHKLLLLAFVHAVGAVDGLHHPWAHRNHHNGKVLKLANLLLQFLLHLVEIAFGGNFLRFYAKQTAVVVHNATCLFHVGVLLGNAFYLTFQIGCHCNRRCAKRNGKGNANCCYKVLHGNPPLLVLK